MAGVSERPKSSGGSAALPLRAIAPGLVYVLLLDLVAVSGSNSLLPAVFSPWMLILAVIPWITLLVLRVSPALLGFTRKGALAMFGWGMLAGAVWRGISLGINTLWVVGATRLSNGAAAWVTGVALVPTIEEIFFRGYLGRTLVSSLGRFWGIVLQAILFSLHPGHWVQGWPHLISIFGFGLLAGWLVSTRGGLWSALGAHAFANALPAMLHMVTS